MTTRLMIIVGSVRPGRIGLPIAGWAREHAEAHGGFEIDFVDLAELALPFMDEPISRSCTSTRSRTPSHGASAWPQRMPFSS